VTERDRPWPRGAACRLFAAEDCVRPVMRRCISSGLVSLIGVTELCRVAPPCSGQDGRLEGLLAPLAEGSGGGRLWGARFGVVEALVLSDHHVDRALGHRVGHPGPGEPVLEGLGGYLLVAHGLTEYLGHDLRHVVEGQVLRAEDRDVARPAP